MTMKKKANPVKPTQKNPAQMRINKFIAENTEYSRRKADELIGQGVIFVNDKKLSKPGVDVDPQKDTVSVCGRPITTKEEKIYLALNKPSGYVTTRQDKFKENSKL